MSSLLALKEKLGKLPKAEGLCSGPQRRSDSADDTTGYVTGCDNTSELTENTHSSWVVRIGLHGNKLEDWQEYIHYLQFVKQFPSNEQRRSDLLKIYEKAYKAISLNDNKKNPSYAQFLINYANLKIEEDEDEAKVFINLARTNMKSSAIIHVTAAQFELSSGNISKSRKILEKAKELQAKPTELLKIAYTNLTLNKSILLSQQDKLDHGFATSSSVTDLHEFVHTGRSTEKASETHQPNQQSKPFDQNSLPEGHSNTDEPPNVSTKPDLTGFRVPDIHSSRRFHSARGLGDGDTAPLDNRQPTQPTQPTQSLKFSLRPYNSTPNCSLAFRQPADNTAEGKSRSFALGRPLRVKRLALPTHRETSRVDDSDESEDDNFYNSVKPLPDSHVTPQQVEAPMETTIHHINRHHSGMTGDGARFHVPMDTHPAMTPVSPMDCDNDFRKLTLENALNNAIIQTRDLSSLQAGVYPSMVDRQPVSGADASVAASLLAGSVGCRNDSSANQPHQLVTSQQQPGEVQQVAARRAPSEDKVPAVHHQITAGTVPQGQPRNQQPDVYSQPLVPVAHPGYTMNSEAPGMTPSHHGQRMLPTSTPVPIYNYGIGQHSQHQQHPGYMNMCTPLMANPNDIITVNGKMYSVLKCVGRGGSSKVYRVLDQEKNVLAVKKISLDGADQATIEGYKNEITLLSRLQKYPEKVVRLVDYEYNESANVLFVVMENGDSDLAMLFRNRGKQGEITDSMKMFYWEEMLKAVKVLHEEGIVHSDLKPANFLLVAGNLKLIDFGIANAIQQDKTSVIRDTQIGTLNFMSPEAIMDTCGGPQAVDELGRVKPRYKISVKSDVWSLGCILYNMVYSRTPFQHITNQLAKLQAITNPNHQISFPDLNNKDLLGVLKKCLVRDPKQRPDINELLRHPYINKTVQYSAPALKKENLAQLMMQMSQACVSPSSLSRISEGLFAQFQAGKEMDVSSFIKKNPHRTDASQQPEAITTQENRLPPNASRGQNKPPPKIIHIPRAPLRSLNFEDIQS